MTSICWRLVDILSQTLEASERDAVRGDFAESGESGEQALRDVLGLVVRRQAALWNDWRPWLTLVAVILPLGMSLSIISRLTASQSATYIWLYANNWDWSLLNDAGFWRPFADSLTLVLVSCLTLVCWSWTAGLVLGSISRKIVPVYAVLFCLTLVFGGLLGAPQYFAYLVQATERPLSPNATDPISALAFYRVTLPLIVQAGLVAVPSVWGMRQGADLRAFPPLLRMVLWTAAIVTLAMLVVEEPGFGFFLRAYWPPRIWQGGQLRFSLQLVVYWPVAYLAANAIRRFRENHI